MKPIKFSSFNLKKNELDTVTEIIKSGWLTHGKYTQSFEEEFKKFTKAKYAITVSSATAGLHLSCLAAGFKKGDEVIVPSQTHTATAHAVELTGAKAILADIDLYTGNINLDEIKKKITKKTKGCIIVHMAGFPCKIDQILKICKKFNIKLIEDCAHGLGTNFKNKHVGNFGESGVFSFYPTKQITTGEGGMVITNSFDFAKKIKTLKAFGIDKDINERKKPGFYDVKELGCNYRITDFQSAIGYFQLKKYKKNLKIRKENAKTYYNILKKSFEIITPKFDKNSSYFIFQIFSKNRDILCNKLKENNIGYSIHYATPLHKMTYYKKKYRFKKGDLINSSKYGDENISLPVHHALKKSDIIRICKVLLKK